MPFKDELECKLVPGENQVEVMSTFRYWSTRLKQEIAVPAGFICDGASIPKALWSVLGHPFDKSYREAAVLHDFLCRSGIIPRDEADQIFYDALVETGMDYLEAQTFYRGVRTGSLYLKDNYKEVK